MLSFLGLIPQVKGLVYKGPGRDGDVAREIADGNTLVIVGDLRGKMETSERGVGVLEFRDRNQYNRRGQERPEIFSVALGHVSRRLTAEEAMAEILRARDELIELVKKHRYKRICFPMTPDGKFATRYKMCPQVESYIDQCIAALRQ